MKEMIITAIPWAISILSVFVSAWAIRSNKKLAYKQAAFDRMSKNYEDFLIAFSAVAYDRYNPQKRAALSHALYRSALLASPKTRIELQFFAEHTLGAKDNEDLITLEGDYMTKLLACMNSDLRKIWKTGKISKLSAPKDGGNTQTS